MTEEKSKRREQPLWILLGAITGVLTTLGLAALTWWRTGGAAEDFPAWLEAWATLLGVGAAIVAGFYAARAFLLEHQREQRWEEQQRSAQASLVAAWPGQPVTVLRDGLRWIHTAHAHVRNASPLPASQVEVDFYVTLVDGQGTRHGTEYLGRATALYVPPGDEPTVVTYRSSDTKPPGKRVAIPPGMSPRLSIETFFRDAAGQIWFRDQVGQLVLSNRYDVSPH